MLKEFRQISFKKSGEGIMLFLFIYPLNEQGNKTTNKNL